MSSFRLSFALTTLLGFSCLPACTTVNTLPQEASVPAPTLSEQQAAQSAVDDIFQRFYQFELDQSPVLRSRLGYSGQFEWDDISTDADDQRIAFWQSLRNELSDIREDALSADERASYRTLLEALEFRLLMVPFSHHEYAFSQLGGWHTEVVAILTNHHPVHSIPDAQDYISRLQAIPALFKRWQENMRSAADSGIVPPAFVYASAESSIRAIVSGEPFTQGQGDSPLWADFSAKLDALNLYPSTHKLLERKARNAMLQSVKPAYDNLLAVVQELKAKAPANGAASTLPDGLRYYQLLLAHYSNSQLDADYLHQLGLAEVSRIQSRIRAMMPALGYDGPADAPLRDMMMWAEARATRFANTEQGRDEFIGFQKARIRDIASRLPYYFTRLPTTPLAVRLTEDYRAPASPVAFYEAPSLDGARPGIYYINPLRMNDLPRYRLAALAFHEAIPGHHLQIALAQENEALPEFRRILDNSAFSEGWALYAEKFAAEMGAYQSTEEEYGQLVMELWRAVRLVLDTGLNAKGWSREQAVQYRLDNTPFSKEDSEQAISRYLVMPGQAVAYKMGQLKIDSIRQQVQDILGSRFDLAAFHSALLSQGAIPLDVLQEWMVSWAKIQRRQAAAEIVPDQAPAEPVKNPAPQATPAVP
ncbi:DUF885 domain-containing protein [Thalassolituus sp. LLYu03]|uniref:DUF885 domain-containing protein n=1 Tax=Thalassolituus sp. LLYu03 TaxID=3421656 RepID=UPI003D2D3370